MFIEQSFLTITKIDNDRANPNPTCALWPVRWKFWNDDQERWAETFPIMKHQKTKLPLKVALFFICIFTCTDEIHFVIRQQLASEGISPSWHRSVICKTLPQISLPQDNAQSRSDTLWSSFLFTKEDLQEQKLQKQNQLRSGWHNWVGWKFGLPSGLPFLKSSANRNWAGHKSPLYGLQSMECHFDMKSAE